MVSEDGLSLLKLFLVRYSSVKHRGVHDSTDIGLVILSTERALIVGLLAALIA